MNTIHDTGFGDSEMGQKARAWFEERIAATLTEGDIGKHLVIDTETGDYELDVNKYEASNRAYRKRPEARTRYGVKLGYRAASTTVGWWRNGEAKEYGV